MKRYAAVIAHFIRAPPRVATTMAAGAAFAKLGLTMKGVGLRSS
jgi:hypothetical protein